MQKIAGIISEIEEMHVDPSGNLLSDEEFVKQVMWKHSTSLGKALTALHKRPGYQKAKDFIKQWLEKVAVEIGLDPVPSFDDPMLYQGRKPADMLGYIRNLLTDMLKAQNSGDEELTEDDYDMGTPSGDTDSMNIAEAEGLSAVEVIDTLSKELSPEHMKLTRIQDTKRGYVEFRWDYWDPAPEEVVDILDKHYDVRMEEDDDMDTGRYMWYELRPKKQDISEDDFSATIHAVDDDPVV